MWMKYRHKWNSGIDKEVTWVQLTKRENCTIEEAEELAKNEISELSSGYNYPFDGWRGIEHEIVKYPPLEVVANLIFEQRKQLQYRKELINYYTILHGKIVRG